MVNQPEFLRIMYKIYMVYATWLQTSVHISRTVTIKLYSSIWYSYFLLLTECCRKVAWIWLEGCLNVTGRLPECDLNVTWMWPECYRKVAWMWREGCLNVTGRLPECDLNVTWMWPERLNVTERLPECDGKVTWMWPECCRKVTWMWWEGVFWGCRNVLGTLLERCLNVAKKVIFT